MKSGGASRTSVFVCQGRAAGDGHLAVGRFSDPIAAQLLRPDELEQVRRAQEPPESVPDARARMAVESVRACAEVVVPRTVLIDEAVDAAVSHGGVRQVVLLGAGLDARAWRLPCLSTSTVFSVDHPASQADTRSRSAGLTPLAGRLVFVPVDLAADPLARALADAGHDATLPTVWVWEGVVPYLERDAVAGTVTAIGACSAPGSVLVVNYQTPSVRARVGRWVVTAVMSRLGVESPTADEPWRSRWTPPQMAKLLTAPGFAVERDVDLLTVAAEVGSTAAHARSLSNGRVVIARLPQPQASTMTCSTDTQGP